MRRGVRRRLCLTPLGLCFRDVLGYRTWKVTAALRLLSPSDRRNPATARYSPATRGAATLNRASCEPFAGAKCRALSSHVKAPSGPTKRNNTDVVKPRGPVITTSNDGPHSTPICTCALVELWAVATNSIEPPDAVFLGDTASETVTPATTSVDKFTGTFGLVAEEQPERNASGTKRDSLTPYVTISSDET